MGRPFALFSRQDSSSGARFGAPCLFLFSLPLFVALVLPAADNFFWCEDAAWFSRAGRLALSTREIIEVYGRDYNPLFLLSVYLQAACFGLNPAAAAAANATIHLLSGFFLAGIFERLLGRPVAAAMLAVIWTISPHTDETLFWMGSRGHALAFLFTSAAWYAFELRRRFSLLPSLLLFISALLSKETAVILPVILFARLVLLDSEKTLLGSLRATGGFWAIAAAYIGFRILVLDGGGARFATGGAIWEPEFLIRKFCFFITMFLELRALSWQGAPSLMVAFGTVILFLTCGGRAGKFSVVWLVIALLPVLPIPKHSPRYELLSYPAFLFGVAALAENRGLFDRSLLRRAAGALAVMFIFYQSYFVFLDELDYDMRSRYVETLYDQYAEVAGEIPDGGIVAIVPSGVSVQPEINARTLVPKLHAPIPGGLWGIIAPEDLVGMAEFTRGRAVLPLAGPLVETNQTILLRHTNHGFSLEVGSAAAKFAVVRFSP